MKAVEYRERLLAQISEDERCLLEASDPSLVINEHNRRTLLEMRAGSCIADEDFDEELALALDGDLRAYLGEYMADQPEGHKWIVVASLYLAFVARRPMHAIDRAGIIIEERDSATVYYCPSKTSGESLICDCCVCEPLATRLPA